MLLPFSGTASQILSTIVSSIAPKQVSLNSAPIVSQALKRFTTDKRLYCIAASDVYAIWDAKSLA